MSLSVKPNPLQRAINQLHYLASKVKDSPSRERIMKASAVIVQLFYETYRALALRTGKVIVPFMPDRFALKAAEPMAIFLLTTDRFTREETVRKLVDAMIYYFTHPRELGLTEENFLNFGEFAKRAQAIAAKIGGIIVEKEGG